MNVDEPPLDETVMDETSLCETMVDETLLGGKNDFTEIEKGGACSQCFFPFMWFVKALSLKLPTSNILQQ